MLTIVTVGQNLSLNSQEVEKFRTALGTLMSAPNYFLEEGEKLSDFLSCEEYTLFGSKSKKHDPWIVIERKGKTNKHHDARKFVEFWIDGYFAAMIPGRDIR